MARLEIYWNKIVSLTQGQQIIIKNQELNRLWADNHTKKMLEVTTTTWDKWRNVVGTKEVLFVANKGWEQEDEPPKARQRKHKTPKEKRSDIVVFTDGSEKSEKKQMGLYREK